MSSHSIPKTIQYECVDGLLKIKFTRKVENIEANEDRKLRVGISKNCQKLKIIHKNLRIFAKETAIFSNDGILTLRFQFDKQCFGLNFLDEKYANKPLLSLSSPSFPYKGPQVLDTLSCAVCENSFLKADGKEKLRVKSAPSENWKEVVELWQCHDEDYNQYIDLHSKQIKIPLDLNLIRFNQLILSLNSTNQLRREGAIQDNQEVHCKTCNQLLGCCSEGERAWAFVSKIKEVAEYFNLEEELKVLIYNHGRDNLKQDIVFMDESKQRITKVKVLSAKTQIASKKYQGNGEPIKLHSASKVLVSEVDKVNPMMLVLIQEMNICFVLNDQEHQALRKILKVWREVLPPRAAVLKNGLYHISYLQHDFE